MNHGLDILFFDLEVHPKSNKILEYGAILNGNEYRGTNHDKFKEFIRSAKTLCGHNVIAHDIPILQQQTLAVSIPVKPIIDTLYLSVLFFPKKKYHPLIKDYQLVGTEINNPLADSKLARQVLWDTAEVWQDLPNDLKRIYYHLLKETSGFDGFFLHVMKEELLPINKKNELGSFIKHYFSESICEAADLSEYIQEHPIALSFALAFISVDDSESLLPEWISHQFPQTLGIINTLRLYCPANNVCTYCQQLSPLKGLRRFFGFDSFRRFEEDGEIPLQQQVVEAAMANKSFLAIFPTGGGKSLTFQLPALMKGVANRSLTVIISPLQSLMKDQVDVLRERHDRTDAVTINGMLSPLERSEAIERIEAGGINLLYISPESLRSRTIARLFLKRQINRFVIDEAHCFSSWGQDFRVDYLYIGKFIKKLQAKKRMTSSIPVSCFTATAKPTVIEDICDYFQKQLNLNLKVFQTSAKRKNLHYFVNKVEDKAEKYEKLKTLVQSEEGAKIVYVSRVKRAEELAEQLLRDGISAGAYHGKMEREDKIRIQNEFMSEEGELEVIVATSAFGMGVDKDNVKMVIHYNISDSLENYMQESGRAGRRADLQAKCYVLFNEIDLDAHFSLLNLSKLSHKEVYQIWQGIKQFKSRKFTKSALEIATKAGWDSELRELESRVKVALAALEESGYVVREENAANVFAQSILVKNVEEAREMMNAGIHHFISQQQLNNAGMIFSSLLSRAKSGNASQVDYIAESLGIDRNEVTSTINIFKEIGILNKEKDLTAYYFTVQGKRNSANVFIRVSEIEKVMFRIIFPNENIAKKTIYLRELNEEVNENGIECNLVIIQEILNYWAQINYIRKERTDRVNSQYQVIRHMSYSKFSASLEQRLDVAAVGIEVLKQEFLPSAKEVSNFKDKRLIEFSVLELKNKIEELSGHQEPVRFYEFLLLYFHHLKILELKDGLMIFYNPMKITRLVDNNRKQYTKEDYQQLEQYYQSKTEQIHIVGEYAKKQLENTIAATQFVDDYFILPYEDFLSKYFNRRKGKIKQPITEEKFRMIFGELSTEQESIVRDKGNDNILVAAGPGSGKTRVLVHKVASLLLMEDIKSDQFLMLTFSRPAALEFKGRLKNLIGTIAYQVDIFTYHGFAFQLMGRIGDLDRARNIIPLTKAAIEEEEIPLDRIKNKSVIVIDEYQDVSREEYDFIMAIIDKAEKIRMIVAGDDDQNIYEFRGTSVEFMRAFIHRQEAAKYYLTKNYRSKHNLVEFSNLFLQTYFSSERMKNGIPLTAFQQRNGIIEIVKYTSSNLIIPLVEQLSSKELQGTTAVLTSKNEEAVLIASLLNQLGLPAQLIMDKQGFSLRDLLELRTFSHFIYKNTPDDYDLLSNEKWEALKVELFKLYSSSGNLNLVQKIISEFEKLNQKKFRNVWNSFLKESQIQDFYHPEKSAILVSTMHKSKGKEFDNVFVLLNNYQLRTEEEKRVLYVAITRAKTNLFLHTNTIHFPKEQILGLQNTEDLKQYPFPNTLILDAGMKDIWLGFAKREQIIYNIKHLSAGCILIPSQHDSTIFMDEQRNEVLKLSKGFEERLKHYLKKGYTIRSIRIRYIVVWYDEKENQAYRVVLPEIVLRK